MLQKAAFLILGGGWSRQLPADDEDYGLAGLYLRMIDLLQSLGSAHYIKKDLQKYLPAGYHNPMRVQQHHERVVVA
jgi:hypothetical protein